MLRCLVRYKMIIYYCCYRLTNLVSLHENIDLKLSLSKKRYPLSLVLVSSRNEFEREFTIELK